MFEDWKTASNNCLTIKTIFYYSKKSDKDVFNYILRQYRGISLPQKYRKELFQLRTITDTINARYLPADIFDKHLSKSGPLILCAKSHLGTGKTTAIKTHIKANKNLRVLYVAPRVAFAQQIYGDLKEFGYVFYTDLRKNINLCKDKLVCQLESLHRVQYQDYDIIVLDEVESVLKQLTSTETNKKMTTTYKVFQQLIKNTPKILLLDAFLTEHSISTIQTIKDGDIPTRTVSIVNNFQPYNRKATELKDLNALLHQAKDQVYNKRQRIVIITLSKTEGDLIHAEFSQMVDGFTPRVKYYYGAMSQREKKFDDVENEWGQVDVLIYTPIITCGVNYDPEIPTFHTLYIWATAGSAVVRDLAQASLRVRKLINDDCYFAVSRRNYHINTKASDVGEIGFNEIKEGLLKKQSIIQGMGFSAEEIYEWGIDNLAFKKNEEEICKRYLLEMIYEYLRLCGYAIVPYQKDVNFFKQEGGGEKDYGSYNDIQSIEGVDYVFFERNPENLTEENKQQMAKYKFDKIFDMEKCKDDTTRQLFWQFMNSGNRIDNLLCEEFDSIREYQNLIEEQQENTFDIFMDFNFMKKTSLMRVLDLLGCKKSWEVSYSSVEVDEKLPELVKLFNDDLSVWGIRKSRGKNEKTWVNGCIKQMLKDWVNTDIDRKRVRVDGDRIYKYELNLNREMTDLFVKTVRARP